jgi:hypothetical protein
MGNVTSLFDCAVNPLAPLPPEDLAEGPPRPVLIEDARPLRDSGLWRLNRAFYEAQGLRAWSSSVVPHFVTSNAAVAKAYARVVLGVLRDTYAGGAGERGPAPGADPAKPVYIVELGAGHGKLGYLIVETLLRYRSFYPPHGVPGPDSGGGGGGSPQPRTVPGAGIPFKYVLTDAVAATVEAWTAHPSLRDFIAAGVLDVAVFDAERDSQVRRRKAGASGGREWHPRRRRDNGFRMGSALLLVMASLLLHRR